MLINLNSLLSGIMRLYTSFYITPEELKLVKLVKENFIKHITFINDIYNFEKEVLAAKSGFKLSAIYSLVLIVIDLCNISKHKAKRIMWQIVCAWEA
jgi:aristolochene synthase